jgi:hypothetical protein
MILVHVEAPLFHPLQLDHDHHSPLFLLLMHILRVSLEQGRQTLLQIHMQQEQVLLRCRKWPLHLIHVSPLYI